MDELLSNKIREQFSAMAIYKDPTSTGSLFAGRNLPSFVKDFLLKRYINPDGSVNSEKLTSFLDMVIPTEQSVVKDKLDCGEELTLLTRFIVYIDLVKGIRRFSIPDMGIKQNEGQIPEYVYKAHTGELVDGEKWGIIKLALLPDDDGKKNHVEMVDYKPFKPYKSVDINYLKNAREAFSTKEWIDFLLSSMEYDANGFASLTEKLEFITRLLIFVEPRLNVIELAPKGTGKSYVFGNLSKYGWLVSGGKVTRAKLFYDKARKTPGIMLHHDLVALDEIQSISFTDTMEMRSILKNYLEYGKTNVDNYEFMSECGLILLGNIPLTEDGFPISDNYVAELPEAFKESALLDRFHGFIEGWLLPRVTNDMALRDWTLNVEFFSEVLHQLRTAPEYSAIVNQSIEIPQGADMRHKKAVIRTATAYMKLLFPHILRKEDMNMDDFYAYCLKPAIHRRDIIRQQCSKIDLEGSFSKPMPDFSLK